MPYEDSYTRELKAGIRSAIIAAGNYRRGHHVPGLTYDTGEDRDFALSMRDACLNRALADHRVLTRYRAIKESRHGRC